MDGRSCSCMLYSEIHSKLEHEMGGRNMSYTLDLIVASIGINEILSIGINIDIFLYTHICFVLFLA